MEAGSKINEFIYSSPLKHSGHTKKMTTPAMRIAKKKIVQVTLGSPWYAWPGASLIMMPAMKKTWKKQCCDEARKSAAKPAPKMSAESSKVIS